MSGDTIGSQKEIPGYGYGLPMVAPVSGDSR